MRFILNFIFFGVLFYAIHTLFPDTFSTMVGWADKIYEFMRDLLLQLFGKIQDIRESSGESHAAATQPAHGALLLFGAWMLAKMDACK